jgi:uncharacterized membrane protein YdbT with pleckstrin-like domain
VFWAVVAFLVPFAAWIFLTVGSIFAFLIIGGILLGSLMLYMAWYSWNNTMLLVTNERLVFLEQKGLFQRELVECDLDSIQQVSHHVHGILHTVMGYGNISIYTGGSQQPILIQHMPDPYGLQQGILAAKSGSPVDAADGDVPLE